MLTLALKVSLFVFMAGSLLEMGLALRPRDAVAGLADRRFLRAALLAGFVAGPALAWGLAQVLPLAPGHATGLVLLGLAPAAPFLPLMAERAGGDRPGIAAMLLLAAAGTVVLMPLAVPVLAPGLSVDAWTVARPLLVMVLLPLAIGMALLRWAPGPAAAMRPWVKRAAGVAAVALLVLCAVMYGPAFVATFGHFAIGAQVIFLAAVTMVALALGRGLPESRRSVLGLGMCTRNVGAALAPLLAVPGIDEDAMVMVALGVPVQIVCALAAAAWFARRAAAKGGGACRSG